MSINKSSKEELGKGIRALLGNNKENPSIGTIQRFNSINEIPIHQIEVNPYQPRNEFDETLIDELASSIKIHGLIQPITVRKLSAIQYQIISGERRWRAAQKLGLVKIPAYIREANDQTMLEMALVENIQRQELNPVEIAISLKRLIDECQLTHDALSERVGKDRSTVTNYLRILKLPPEIQQGLKDQKLSMGHAKAILSLEHIDQQISLYKEVLANQLSVRAAESSAKSFHSAPPQNKLGSPSTIAENPYYRDISDRLSRHFDTKVNLQQGKKGGQIVIHFSDVDNLNDLLDKIYR